MKAVSLFDTESHMNMLSGLLTMMTEHMGEHTKMNYGGFRGVALYNALLAAGMHVKTFYAALDALKNARGELCTLKLDELDFEVSRIESILSMCMHHAGRFFHGGAGCIEAGNIHQCITSALDRINSITRVLAAVTAQEDEVFIASQREEAPVLH